MSVRVGTRAASPFNDTGKKTRRSVEEVEGGRTKVGDATNRRS
jgi:hypothetical protein